MSWYTARACRCRTAIFQFHIKRVCLTFITYTLLCQRNQAAPSPPASINPNYSISVISKGWIRGTVDDRALDLLINTEQWRTWAEARQNCNHLGGHLLLGYGDHVIINGYTESLDNASTESLFSFLKKNYDRGTNNSNRANVCTTSYLTGTYGYFWIGMHQENNIYFWNRFGIPEPAGSLWIGWMSIELYSNDVSPMCCGLNSPSFDFYKIGIFSCNKRKFHICYRDKVIVTEDPECGDGWLSNPLVDACFKFYPNRLSYDAAIRKCEDDAARISHSYGSFVTSASDKYEPDYIIQWTNTTGECGVSFGAGKNFACDVTRDYPFVCEKARNRKDYHILFDQHVVDRIIHVTLKERLLDTHPRASVVETLSCKIQNETTGPCWNIIWFKDGMPLNIPEEDDNDNSREVRLVWVYRGEPYYYLNHPLYNYTIPGGSMQGIYWCEVATCRPYKRFPSKTSTLIFPETFAFVGGVSLQQGFQNRGDYLKFNLMAVIQGKMTAMNYYFENVLKAAYETFGSAINMDMHDIVFLHSLKQFSGPSGTKVHFTVTIDLFEVFRHMPDKSWFREKDIMRWITASLVTAIKEQDKKRVVINWPRLYSESVIFKSKNSCFSSLIPRANGTSLYFPSAMAGHKANSLNLCYPGNDDISLATATCSGSYYTGYQFSDLQIRQNCIEADDVTSDVTDDLNNLLETPIINDNVHTVIEILANKTSKPAELRARDIALISTILDDVSRVDNGLNAVGDGFIDTVNNVLEIDEKELRIAQKVDNSANRIILAVEKFTDKQQVNSSGEQILVRPHVSITVLSITGTEELVVGHVFATKNNTATQLTPESLSNLYHASEISMHETSAAILLPVKLLRDEIASGGKKLSFVIFTDGRLFRAAEGHGYQPEVAGILNSLVISAKINDRMINNLSEKVKAIFLPLNKNADKDSSVCVYWDFNWADGNGRWSTDGCALVKSVEGRVICECDHLTYFAVLMDVYGQENPAERDPMHETLLEHITIFGLSLSIIGLSLTLLNFVVFSALRHGRGQQTLLSLSVALLCTYIVFLAGIDEVQSYGTCIAVAALLHYFLLASFMWMLMEAVLQYLRFVKVLGTYVPKYMLKTSIPAWGIPLVIVVLVLAIDHKAYKGGQEYCWMSLTTLYYAFLLPVGLIIATNAVLYLIINIKLCCNRRDGLRSNQSKTTANILRIQASLACLLLLGLTWVFGYLAIEDGRLAFTYMFTILNSLQGFFIFLMFTLREKKIRGHWKKLFSKCFSAKDITRTSPSATPAGKRSDDNQYATNTTSESIKLPTISFENKAIITI